MQCSIFCHELVSACHDEAVVIHTGACAARGCNLDLFIEHLSAVACYSAAAPNKATSTRTPPPPVSAAYLLTHRRGGSAPRCCCPGRWGSPCSPSAAARRRRASSPSSSRPRRWWPRCGCCASRARAPALLTAAMLCDGPACGWPKLHHRSVSSQVSASMRVITLHRGRLACTAGAGRTKQKPSPGQVTHC